MIFLADDNVLVSLFSFYFSKYAVTLNLSWVQPSHPKKLQFSKLL